VLTVTHGKIENGSVLVHNGKIAAVGRAVNAPANAKVIDATGKFVMPGIVDSHSHLALDNDVNEATAPVVAQVKMADAFDYTDKAIYQALAGGVTTSLLLHGSADMIGGEAVVIKHKFGDEREQMLFPGAPRSIKFASGENPKRVFGSRNQIPSTRMGNFFVQREALQQAREYMRQWDEYDAKTRKGDKTASAPKRDLKMDELADVLRGKVMVQIHCYRADELLTEIAIAKDVPLAVFFWNPPKEGWVSRLKGAGMKVWGTACKGESARRMKERGADAVIAQSQEAGGHVKSSLGAMGRVPAVVDALDQTPVIAAGGIADGRSIARAMKSGAQGVSLGTRFVACDEAWIHPHYKRRVVEATAADTEFSEDLFDGGWPDAPHRFLKNKTYFEWVAAGRPPPGKRPGEGDKIGTMRFPWADRVARRYGAGMLVPTFDGDPEDFVMWAGTSVDQVRDLKPASEIVRDLVRETEDALAG